jgi:hypothetical protein
MLNIINDIVSISKIEGFNGLFERELMSKSNIFIPSSNLKRKQRDYSFIQKFIADKDAILQPTAKNYMPFSQIS